MGDDEWFLILGSALGDEGIDDCISKHGISPDMAEIRQFNGGKTVIKNYYEKGISTTFIEGKLDSVDFFSIDSKFKQVDGSILPLGFELEFTGKDLVEKFGEPLEKGGGFNQKMDIWLRWGKFQVDLNDRSWETANDAKWKSLTIFLD